MTPKRKILVNLIATLLLGIGMVAWVLLRLTGTGALADPVNVTADFAASGGVFTGQEVTYRGVAVGRVGPMSLNADGVDIELVIEPEWEGRIPATVGARVRSKSAVGEQFVDLYVPEGGSTAGTLADGDVIARDLTRLPVDFQELLTSLDKVLGDVPPEQTSRLIGELADGLRGRSDDIASILRSLGTLSDAFASTASEQQRLLDNSTEVGREFLRTRESLGAALRAADRVFTGIGDEPEELRSFLAANDRFARRGSALLASHGENLAFGIDALADLSEWQLDNRDMVKQSLTYTPQFLQAIEDSSIPWRAPTGETFYRIRVGLVLDNVPDSWPCEYKNRAGYERLPHLRDDQPVDTRMQCEPADGDEAARDLLSAIEGYLAEPSAATPASAPATVAPGTAVLADAAGDPRFEWPLYGTVTSGFGPRWGRPHQGIDIDGVTGDPVKASAAGVVTFAGTMDGYGNVVVISHAAGFATLYSHLDRIDVIAGVVVPGGAVIGTVGCTGRCFGDHLHFEIASDGVPVDPLLYLPGGALYQAIASASETDLPSH